MLGATTLAEFVAACGGSTANVSGSLKQATVQLLWLEDVEFGGNYAAAKQGFMKQQGLKQTLIPGGPQTNAVQAVAGGSAPIGLIGGSQDIIEAVASGIPVKMIATTYQTTTYGLLSLASNPIRTPQDAIGKKIGLQAGARPFWNEILAVNHIAEDKMTIVPAGFDPTPLVTHQIDGYWAYAFNQPVSLELKGIPTYMMLASDAGTPSYSDVIFTLDSALKTQEDLLVRWLRATIQGWEYFLQHPVEMANYAISQSPSLKLDPTQQVAQAKAEVPFLTSPLTNSKGLLWIDQSSLAQSAALLHQVGQVNRLVAPSETMTTTILEKAYGGKTSLPI